MRSPRKSLTFSIIDLPTIAVKYSYGRACWATPGGGMLETTGPLLGYAASIGATRLEAHVANNRQRMHSVTSVTYGWKALSS